MLDKARIKRINKRLLQFGYGDNNEPLFRIVWSEDQFEYRHGTYDKYSSEGLWIGQETCKKYVPKYKQWVPHQWVLERLSPVPPGCEIDHVQLSYEPIWAFGKGVLPSWGHTKVLVETILDNVNKPRVAGPKYPMPEILSNSREAIEERANKLMDLLFTGEPMTYDSERVFVGSTKVFKG